MHPTFTRRRALASLASLACAPTTPAWAQAASWPSRPVRIIVPFAPGGGSDISARALGELIAPELGQAVVVENKPGAGSAIGVTAAAQARDGHTLLMGSNSMVINPSLNPQLGYDVARDFEAVCMVSSQPLVAVVAAGSPLRSLADVVALGKGKPGQLTAGNSGNGTLAHIAAELFASEAGIDITPVPYKGESALMPDVISGQVAFGFLNLPTVLPHVRAGRLRALAVTAAQPLAELPGVPTVRALQYPGLEVQGWAVLVAPKGTVPAEGLARLETLVQKALGAESLKTRFQGLGVAPVMAGRQATAQFLATEAARYAAVIKARGIKAE